MHILLCYLGVASTRRALPFRYEICQKVLDNCQGKNYFIVDQDCVVGAAETGDPSISMATGEATECVDNAPN